MVKTNFSNTIFYIVAHADDWQLFMNPEAYNDLVSPENKVIFIITTAGDAGKGETFWRAREEGMKASITYCLAPRHQMHFSEGVKIINGQTISYWSVNNSISYFLRLPDGGVTGEGFAETDYRNLQKLEAGIITTLTALDGSFTLSSPESFGDLLKNILFAESTYSTGRIFIKFLDPDAHNNYLDHVDHQCTGRAILAINKLPDCSKVLFKGYGNSCANQLTPEEIFWKAGMFAAYENTVFEKTGYSTLAEDIHLYKKWILSRPEFYESGEGAMKRLPNK